MAQGNRLQELHRPGLPQVQGRAIVTALGRQELAVRAHKLANLSVEFWRDDPRGEILGLSTSQFISLVMFAAGLGLTFYWRRREEAKPASTKDTRSHDVAAQVS